MGYATGQMPILPAQNVAALYLPEQAQKQLLQCKAKGLMGLEEKKQKVNLLWNCKILQNFLINESSRMCKARKMAKAQRKAKIRAVFAVGM